jgi:hypothetical protein
MQVTTSLIRYLNPVGAVNGLSRSDHICNQVARTFDCLRLGNIKAWALDTFFIESGEAVETFK